MEIIFICNSPMQVIIIIIIIIGADYGLQLRFDFDSTVVQLQFDCNSAALRPQTAQISSFRQAFNVL